MAADWQHEFKNFDSLSYFAGVTSAFAEIVAAGVKPLALSHPYSPAQADQMLSASQAIAAGYDVSLFVEDDLLVTPLFPAEVAVGKVVFLLYGDEDVLAAYQQLKADRLEGARTGRLPEIDMDLGRRFGQLLGYDADKIAAMLDRQ